MLLKPAAGGLDKRQSRKFDQSTKPWCQHEGRYSDGTVGGLALCQHFCACMPPLPNQTTRQRTNNLRSLEILVNHCTLLVRMVIHLNIDSKTLQDCNEPRSLPLARSLPPLKYSTRRRLFPFVQRQRGVSLGEKHSSPRVERDNCRDPPLWTS